jgi:hypothetical protein
MSITSIVVVGEKTREGEMMRWLNILIYCMAYVAVALTGCSGTSNEVKKMAADLYAKSSIPEPKPPHKFKSNGCSCFPDGDWVECCVVHDLAYWMGGTSEERENADARLRKCVADKGHPITANLMYYGVRMSGVWWLPTPFRWGFGWPYPQSGPPGKPY